MTENEVFTCDKCGDKNHCAFYEPGADECPYDYMRPKENKEKS